MFLCIVEGAVYCYCTCVGSRQGDMVERIVSVNAAVFTLHVIFHVVEG